MRGGGWVESVGDRRDQGPQLGVDREGSLEIREHELVDDAVYERAIEAQPFALLRAVADGIQALLDMVDRPEQATTPLVAGNRATSTEIAEIPLRNRQWAIPGPGRTLRCKTAPFLRQTTWVQSAPPA